MVTTCCLPLASRIMHINCTAPCDVDGCSFVPAEPLELARPGLGFIAFRGNGACRESSSGQLVLSPNAEVDELAVVKPACTTGCDELRVSLPDANAAPKATGVFVDKFANVLAADLVGWNK